MPESSVPTSTLEPVEQLLTIGVFARRSRLSPKALRLYDRLGLLVPAHVDRDNGYRRYRESQLATARLIAMLRRLDMPLAKVAEVVAAPPKTAGARSSPPTGTRSSTASPPSGSWSPTSGSGCREEGSFDMFEIQEREVPEQLVLTEQRHVLVPSCPLDGRRDGRLVATAAEVGGLAAPVFVVYHGEVNEDSDGPVEVCVPIAAGEEPHGRGDPDRARPSRGVHAASRRPRSSPADPLRLRRRRPVDRAERRTVAGSPREVYFADWDAAGPTDEVCDSPSRCRSRAARADRRRPFHAPSACGRAAAGERGCA